MKKTIKRIIKNLPLYYPIYNWFSLRKAQKDFEIWESAGKSGLPPHKAKQQTLRKYANLYGLRILVETGTFYGDMVEVMQYDFEKIYSIELSNELYKQAVKRFYKAKNVEIIKGDSGVELRNVLNKISEPALFWLDGHYSAGNTAKGIKDTPILEELDCILDAPHSNHVIIIDDARLFGSNLAYPSLDELSIYIKDKRPDVEIFIEDDSIRVTPKG